MPLVHNKHHNTTPKDAIYIGRGSPYGNPFILGVHGNREKVISLFINMVENNQQMKEKFAKELNGKDLVCFCSPKRCHGDYLLKIANGEQNSLEI